jgi:hypothetical protein
MEDCKCCDSFRELKRNAVTNPENCEFHGRPEMLGKQRKEK